MEGSGMGEGEKEEAIYQRLFDGAERNIALVYLAGTMAHIKEHYKEEIDFSEAFTALFKR